MPEALQAVIAFVAAHPWVVLAVPAVFVVFELTVWGPRRARTRQRRYEGRLARRVAHDVHTQVHQRATRNMGQGQDPD